MIIICQCDAGDRDLRKLLYAYFPNRNQVLNNAVYNNVLHLFFVFLLGGWKWYVFTLSGWSGTPGILKGDVRIFF